MSARDRPPLSLVEPNSDLRFYTGQLKAHGGPVLVLGCGDGRIARALCSEGTRVMAVDPSEAMIGVARARFEEEVGKGAVDWRVADLRSLRISERYPLVIAPHNALGMAATEEDLEAVLATVCRHLLASGAFVFDVAAVSSVEAPGRPKRPHPHLHEVQRDGLRRMGSIRRMRLRQFSAQQLEKLLEKNGLIAHERYGGFDGKPFAEGDAVQVGVASPA